MASENRGDAGHHRVDLLWVAHVARDEGCTGEIVGLGASARDDRGARARELVDDDASDALRPAGDQHHLATEIQSFHRSLVIAYGF